jgi:hypothetical protein
MLLKSAVFWGITRHRAVIVYRQFGTTYWPPKKNADFNVKKLPVFWHHQVCGGALLPDTLDHQDGLNFFIGASVIGFTSTSLH